MIRLLLASIFLASAIRSVLPHEHHGEESGASCASTPDVQILAEYNPGIVTVDGHADDWADVGGSEFALLPALDPDEDKAYGGGKITVKALHDGINVFFMLQVDGEYAYSQGVNKKCPSVALMFQVGENATYHDMGGCKDLPGKCTSKSCRGHEVDIMHFSIGSAIPGRLYGANPLDNRDGNGGDRFGHLNDLYAWNPHCRNLDVMGPSVYSISMDYSSGEASEISDSEIDEYEGKFYKCLKRGELKVKISDNSYKCPFGAGKKKQDYRYKVIFQHATGVGTSSNRGALISDALKISVSLDGCP